MTFSFTQNHVATESESAVSPKLIEAYKSTNFEVQTSSPFVLNIGKVSRDLKELFAAASVDCGCFITAFNPLSEPRNEEENFEAQRYLKQRLDSLGKVILDGVGSDPSGKWRGEPSFFVLGLPIEQSKIIGKEFGQNAVVWCGSACIPTLVMLR